MPTSGDASSARHASWRGGSAPSAAPARNSKLLGALLALVCLLLVGLLFGLVVVPFFRHRLATHVVALTPGNLDDWTVPPMLFVEEDLQPLSQISGVNWHDLRGVLDSRMLDALPARLQAAIPQNADVLIVYATAQGISREGEAYLLCTDVDPSGSNDAAGQRRSVYPVRELLQRLADLDVPLKLLILDFGNLVSDPRMGMVINEFPRLLAKPWPNRPTNGSGYWLRIPSVKSPMPRPNSVNRSLVTAWPPVWPEQPMRTNRLRATALLLCRSCIAT